MQQSIQEELQEDWNQLWNLQMGYQRSGIFGPEGINVNYTQQDIYQDGVLNIKRLYLPSGNYEQILDNVYNMEAYMNRLKHEQNLHYKMNNKTQILKIQQPQHLPLFFRHEYWKSTLLNHMRFMQDNKIQYPLNYFFILAKQLINIINSLHQNDISHQKIIADNIVLRREIQYQIEFLPKPNEQQFYQYILNNYNIDSEGTAEELKNRIKKIQVDKEIKQLYLEGTIPLEICTDNFVQKIIAISRFSRLHNRDIKCVNFDNICEYENDQVFLTNFSNQKERNNDITFQDWQDCIIKDYRDLGNILYTVYTQTQNIDRKIHYNFANLPNQEIRQQIIQSLDLKNQYERILICLLDGNYLQAIEEIKNQQIQFGQYFYENFVYNDQMSSYPS